MQERKSKVEKVGSKEKVKRPRSKPKPIPVGPAPSVNGHAEASVPFDDPPRSFFISAAQIKAEKQVYLWMPYLPANELSMIVGDSQAGKSTLLSAVAAGVTRGSRLHGSAGHPQGRVLIFSPEENVSVALRPRLDAHNASLPMVFFGDIGTDGKKLPRMALPNDCGRLTEKIKTMGIRLLIIDPITSYLASGFNPNNDGEVRGLLDQLSVIATESSCTVLITRHYRKSTEGSPLERIGGSAAWGHWPRTVLACGFDPEAPDNRIIAVSKCSIGKVPPSLRYEIIEEGDSSKLVLGEQTSITARDLGIAGLSATDRDALGDAEAFLRSALADGDQPCTDLKAFAMRNMISEVTLRRAKKKLGVESALIVSAGERYHVWRLPDIQVQK